MLPYFKFLDKGYMGFYGMMLLPEGFGRYFSLTQAELEELKEIDAEEQRQKGKMGLISANRDGAGQDDGNGQPASDT